MAPRLRGWSGAVPEGRAEEECAVNPRLPGHARPELALVAGAHPRVTRTPEGARHGLWDPTKAGRLRVARGRHNVPGSPNRVAPATAASRGLLPPAQSRSAGPGPAHARRCFCAPPVAHRSRVRARLVLSTTFESRVGPFRGPAGGGGEGWTGGVQAVASWCGLVRAGAGWRGGGGGRAGCGLLRAGAGWCGLVQASAG